MAAALPIPDEDELPISIEGLKNILECPVCLSPPTSTPIYRCDNGHILCSLCRSKVKICPECRIELGNLRYLTSEKIVTAMLPKVKLFDFHTYTSCIYKFLMTLKYDYMEYNAYLLSDPFSNFLVDFIMRLILGILNIVDRSKIVHKFNVC